MAGPVGGAVGAALDVAGAPVDCEYAIGGSMDGGAVECEYGIGGSNPDGDACSAGGVANDPTAY